ncbi:hypothetical protein [Halorubrum coriense]|uniref:hypothetical protein n=1 Tax=Halorubrum coriense TaxID=64713 RepID=UPI000677F103|nr:hypothetical protein [Halorubrum coriense]
MAEETKDSGQRTVLEACSILIETAMRGVRNTAITQYDRVVGATGDFEAPIRQRTQIIHGGSGSG